MQARPVFGAPAEPLPRPRFRSWVEREHDAIEAAKAYLKQLHFAVYPAVRGGGSFTTWRVTGYTGEYTGAELLTLARAIGFQAAAA